MTNLTPKKIIGWASRTAAKTPRGGARPGAGRKSIIADQRRLTVIVTNEQLEKLDTWAAKIELGRSAAVRALLDKL